MSSMWPTTRKTNLDALAIGHAVAHVILSSVMHFALHTVFNENVS